MIEILLSLAIMVLGIIYLFSISGLLGTIGILVSVLVSVYFIRKLEG